MIAEATKELIRKATMADAMVFYEDILVVLEEREIVDGEEALEFAMNMLLFRQEAFIKYDPERDKKR